MAKKRKRRRASLLTKAINLGVLAMAFSRPITMLLAGQKPEDLVTEATAGMNKGAFNKQFAMQFYGPMVAAILLKKAISMVRRTARV